MVEIKKELKKETKLKEETKEEPVISLFTPSPPPENGNLAANHLEVIPAGSATTLRTITATGSQRKRAAPDSECDTATDLPMVKRLRALSVQPSENAPAAQDGNRPDEFTDVFDNALSGNRTVIEPSPSFRRAQAMKRAQLLETDISDRCVVALIDLFQSDIDAADAYLCLTREGVRKQWVANRVRGIREEDEP